MILTRRDTFMGGVAGALLLGVPGILQAAPTSPTAAVETTSGKVRGSRASGISKFLGIPYGANTALRRFLPPVAPASWSGVRDCVALGRQAPQMDPTPAGLNLDTMSPFVRQVIAAGKQGMEVGNESEDCLVLNVYTPDASSARKRPVMVWFHGGGFAIGSAGDPQYDGTNLAKRGDVVVVGINHRLNALGYLYLGALSDDFADSGNAGHLDMVLALQWVRENIANFGGDPDNVTIFGESGGGSKVTVTLATPAAKGLFHKAIIQSGPAVVMGHKPEAEAHAERTLAELGVSRADVHKLQTMDYARIIDAAKKVQQPNQKVLSPLVDGRTLPRDPFAPTAPDVSRDIPVMIGSTRTEATLFMCTDPLFGKMTEAQARQKAVAMQGAKGDAIIDYFKSQRPHDAPTYWLASLATAQVTWMNSIRIAQRKLDQQAAPVHMFRLDWQAPFDGGILQSPHGIDTDLVFDNPRSKTLMNGNGPDPVKIAAAMSQAWVNFARTGDPSQPGLAWPNYDTSTRETMIFNVDSHVVEDPDGPVRKLLDA